jgi:flagellar hook protein FlgE
MPNFSIPLSGLIASDTALATISNNLANLNTIGYKDTSVNFQDMFYNLLGTNGSGDQLQVGSGTSVASVGTDFSGGSVQSTGVSTDVAITGNGFFVVQNGANSYYTRAGDFTQNASGNLVTADGYQVMGYPATNGVVNTTGGLQPIQVQDGMINPPNATSSLSLQANLSSDTAVGGTYNTSVTVYDSLGTSHVLSVDFTRTSTGWSYNATLPSSDIKGSTGTDTTVQSGTLAFDSSGNLTGSTTNPSTTVNPITSPVAFSVANLADGAGTLTFNWNMASPTGGGLITQVSGASATSTTNQDGYASGSLTGFSIGSDGTITGAFTNGSKILGQVALANFSNLQGLTKVGDSNYAASMSSGSAVVGAPGTSSLGTLTGGSLELSNVDMSQEFSNLIIAERGFQANAKSVTTFDQIAQDTINLIR